ncbi:hypothetical protein EIP91_009117 [Steccherinum ochraceum]|uniref:Uncharacterized protein n=1 Tax=Steccherinum ochraceum TaxID=92696 RepID=A0A4R0R223_9APHY|nr:hypothetical protein EIP91_009117 [Steccherinum ochraceum]
MDVGQPDSTHLTFNNIGLAFSFILFDALISTSLGLGVGSSLVTASVRCVVQLSLVALILQKVFEANNPWAVAGIACLLNILGTIETVITRSKRRYNQMFISVFFGMILSTIPVSIIGIRYAMAVEPFWKPEQYIPVVGMLCGNTISSIVVSVSYVLKELYENKDKVETYLAFGATRFEACKPIAQEALRYALTPTINTMSFLQPRFLRSFAVEVFYVFLDAFASPSSLAVIGIISIPGMMTGAILGGSSVQQAARLQIVIMFMIAASTALSSIVITVLTLAVVVDGDQRIRTDRIDCRPHAVWRARDWVWEKAVLGVKEGWAKMKRAVGLGKSEGIEEEGVGEERRGLLE